MTKGRIHVLLLTVAFFFGFGRSLLAASDSYDALSEPGGINQKAVVPFQKISSPLSDRIVRFVLFSYDQLVADYYEGHSWYLSVLEDLLCEGTGCSSAVIDDVVRTDSLYLEPNPVRFMMKLNASLKAKTGYYFEDE